MPAHSLAVSQKFLRADAIAVGGSAPPKNLLKNFVMFCNVLQHSAPQCNATQCSGRNCEGLYIATANILASNTFYIHGEWGRVMKELLTVMALFVIPTSPKPNGEKNDKGKRGSVSSAKSPSGRREKVNGRDRQRGNFSGIGCHAERQANYHTHLWGSVGRKEKDLPLTI